MKNISRRVGLPFAKRRVVYTEDRIGLVREAFRELQKYRTLPTSLVANNDIVTVGLTLEAQAQDISVPRDLSVVGVGNLEIAAHLQPGLTTVRSPTHSIGTLAADDLLARIQDRAVSLPDELSLELIVRGTTAPPPPDFRKETTP